MNPGMFFDEVLESHEFRSSDTADNYGGLRGLHSIKEQDIR